MVGGLHLGPDVPQHVAGGLDRPGRPLPGYQCVPEALPPAAVSSGDVRSCTESLGLPAQHLRQEKSLPLQVSRSMQPNLTSPGILSDFCHTLKNTEDSVKYLIRCNVLSFVYIFCFLFINIHEGQIRH